MNNHDKENLRFLLTANPETFKDWFDNASADDQTYAVEILKEFAEELKVRISFETEKEINEFSEANKLLKKFML